MTAVLLVDDEPGICDTASFALECEGYVVTTAGGAADALTAFEQSQFDLVLLDIGLPDGSGLDVCRAIRAAGPTPIMILSARGTESDRVVGLELGDDDYVTKAFLSGGARQSRARDPAPARARPLRPVHLHTACQHARSRPGAARRERRRCAAAAPQATAAALATGSDQPQRAHQQETTPLGRRQLVWTLSLCLN